MNQSEHQPAVGPIPTTATFSTPATAPGKSEGWTEVSAISERLQTVELLQTQAAVAQAQSKRQAVGHAKHDQQHDDQADLRHLCHRLQATHRCPGQCVLSRARQERVLREFAEMDVFRSSTISDEPDDWWSP